MFGWLRREPRPLADHRRRMLEALADYPVYEPLHRQGPNCPRHLQDREAREFAARGRDNFSYFMAHRAERLSALKGFLAGFGLSVDLQDNGLGAVSAWLPGHCGDLLPTLGLDETMQIFFRYLKPWGDNLRGLNVIFDLGIFFGECVIARNPRVHWINWPGTSDNGEAAASGSHLAGFKSRRDGLDPIGRMLYLCEHDARDFRDNTQGKRVSADQLLATVRDYSTR
jgi:hypothetical protein